MWLLFSFVVNDTTPLKKHVCLFSSLVRISITWEDITEPTERIFGHCVKKNKDKNKNSTQLQLPESLLVKGQSQSQKFTSLVNGLKIIAGIRQALGCSSPLVILMKHIELRLDKNKQNISLSIGKSYFHRNNKFFSLRY